MKNNHHLPKDKYDFESIESLNKISKESLKEIVPDLVFWLYDQNSPIYSDMALLLSDFQEELIPEFKKVFDGNDNSEKYYCLVFMNNYIDINSINKIKDILERFAYNPSKDEIDEDVHIQARKLLNLRN